MAYSLLAPRVDLSSFGRWLKASLCLYIDSLSYHFFSRIQVTPSVVQLCSDGRVKPFMEVVYEGLFIKSDSEIKLFEYCLQVL